MICKILYNTFILEKSCAILQFCFSNLNSLCLVGRGRRRALPQWALSATCDNITCVSSFKVCLGCKLETPSFHTVTLFPWVSIKHPLKAIVRVVAILSLHSQNNVGHLFSFLRNCITLLRVGKNVYQAFDSIFGLVKTYRELRTNKEWLIPVIPHFSSQTKAWIRPQYEEFCVFCYNKQMNHIVGKSKGKGEKWRESQRVREPQLST